jgi:NADPH-dependent glutamate synthase beta subunit-like oxidoreductase
LFEKQSAVGGQVDAIPKYRLPSSELSRDLERFQNFDLSVVTERAGGVDFAPEALLREGYDAVYIAIGASKATSPGLPGEGLEGVHYALDLLFDVNRGRPPKLGKTILVVGGGDVAIDSVRSAVRLAPGARVAMVYRRTREEAPAGEEELREADPEGIEFRWLLSPVRILGTDHVEGVQFQSMQLAAPDRSGRRAVVPTAAPPEVIPCDTVILAIGQTADLTGFQPDLGLTVGSKGWPEGIHPDGRTAVEGIFASGGRSVVHAMAAGTRAAEAIDAYLSQKDHVPPTPRPDPFGGSGLAERFPSGYSGPAWRP